MHWKTKIIKSTITGQFWLPSTRDKLKSFDNAVANKNTIKSRIYTIHGFLNYALKRLGHEIEFQIFLQKWIVPGLNKNFVFELWTDELSSLTFSMMRWKVKTYWRKINCRKFLLIHYLTLSLNRPDIIESRGKHSSLIRGPVLSCYLLEIIY